MFPLERGSLPRLTEAHLDAVHVPPVPAGDCVAKLGRNT